MMRLICGVLLALLCAVSCAGADSKSLSSKEKYHPGHYILISQRNSVSDEAWDTNPNVRGIQKRYSWMTLEPKKGEYDFSEVRRDLEICAKNGKYLVIFFNDKTFKRDDQRMPDYLLNITVPVSYGANPLRWTPEYKERFKLLIDRLAEEFDDNPYFEGFTFQESALAFSRGELDNEPEARQYTPEKYSEALLELVSYAVGRFEKSQIFWFANFIPKDNKGQYMKMLCDELSQQGVIFAGPDILPYRTALNGDTGVYKTHSQYYGIVPLGNSMQADSYRHHKNDLDLREEEPLPEEGYIPVEDIFLFGRDVLKLNYIFWSHNFVDKKVPHNTFYDGIDVINKYPTFNE